jgi:hypothetical protein
VWNKLWDADRDYIKLCMPQTLKWIKTLTGRFQAGKEGI